MANRWADSCATYGAAADAAMFYASSGANASVSTTGGRWGTGSLTATASASWTKSFSPGLATWTVGFCMRLPAVSTNDFWRGQEGATFHLSMRLNGTDRITITRNGTLLATGTTQILAGVDYMVQLKFTINNTTGSLELWVNGVQETLTFATGSNGSQDTQNGGTAIVDSFLFQYSGSTAQFSEIYINDTTGAVNTGIAGDYRIQTRRVSGAGNSAQFTPSASTNASNVDDAQGPDADTTYNSSSTPGHIDLFQFGAITPTGGTVAAIMHRIIARKDDAGVRTIRPKQRQSSTNYSGTTVAVTTSYAGYTEIVETNPSTTAAYTVAEMRATTPEFGYEEVA